MINPFGNATLIVAFFLCVQSFAVAQTRRSTVSGFVLDAESEESLPGAVVMTDEGNTVANNYGFFSIPLTRGQHTLRTMYLGHSESEMELHFSSDTTIIIRMRPDAVLKESLVTSSNVLRESYTRITASNVLDSPVVLGEPDVLKYVQLLPGVSGGLEGTSSVLVRGGGPDENLFLLDGVPMYNVSHMLGLFSAFSPDAIKNVSFYKDGFPSRFGGRVSSVLDIRTNDGDRHDCHASVTAGLLASRFHFEGPIIKDKTSFSLSARAFNTIFAAPFINRDDCTLYYLFYDLNGKIYHAFSKYDTLTLTAYHGGDTFSYLSDENMVSGPGFRYLAQDGMGMDWGSTLASLKWNHLSRKNFFYSTSISWYGYNMLSEVKSWKTQFNETELDRSLFESWIQDIILKSDLDYSLSPSHKLTAGFSATRHLFTPSVSRRKFLDNTDSAHRNPATEYSGWELAAYIEDEFRPFDSFEMDLGLRYTIMTVGQKTYRSLQPRLSMNYAAFKNMALRASYSRMAQYVHLLSYSQLSMPTDLWVPITDNIPPVLTDHYSGGLMVSLEGWDICIDFYYKHSDNLLEYANSASYLSSSGGWEALVDIAEGKSRGMELSVSRTIGPFDGCFSYTLSKTERRFVSGDLNDREWFPYIYDRTHSIALNMQYKMSPRLSLSAVWILASGNKMTLPARRGLLPDMTQPGFVYEMDVYSKRSNYTLPPSHRLDLSINYDIPSRKGKSIWTAGIYNVYNALNPNLVFTNYSVDDDGKINLGLEKLTYLPILPSVSYTYKF